LGVLVHFSREESLTQGTIRNEADSKFLEGRQYLLLGAPGPKRVFALDSGHGFDRVRAPNRLRPCFRKAEVPDLAFLNQFLYRSRNVFDWHFQRNAMLVEQIDSIDLESLERGFCDLPDVLRPTVEPDLLAAGRIKLEPELGGNCHFLTERRKSLTHELFVAERAVHFGCVEERYAAFDRSPDNPHHLPLAFPRPVPE